MPARLPNLGESPYKTVLDGYLEVTRNADGTFKTGNTYPTPTITGAITATSDAGPHKFGTGDAVATAETPFLINMKVTGSVNSNAWGLICALNFTKAASGTHPVVVGAELDFPHIIGGAATVTDLVAVRIGADNTPPYGQATNVYALQIVNGISQFQGGGAGDITKPSARLGNNTLLSWLDAAGGTTNSAFFFQNASNNLGIGTGGSTRLILTAGGGLLFSDTDPGFANANGRFTMRNAAHHFWVDAAGGATNAMFILGDSDNGLKLGTGNTIRIAISSAGTISFLGYGTGSGVVSVGAADSGGAGFKLLRVPN